MDILQSLNSSALYAISGIVILCVVLTCLIFLLRAYKAGLAIGMDKAVLNRTIVSSATFTVLPSISILLGVIGLSGTLGIPLPWLRLSVIGALHYETTVADAAARAIGMSGLNISEMTLQAFSTIALLMGVGICSGTLCTILFTKPYLNKLQNTLHKNADGKKSGGFGDKAMAAMFIGLISTYVGAYLATFTSTGDIKPILILCCSFIFMGIFVFFIEKKDIKSLENFALAGSMLLAMAVAVLLGMYL